MLIDTHAHVYSEYYDNTKVIIKNAKDEEVGLIIIPAVSFDNFDNIISLSKKNDDIYYALGIHPEAVNKIDRYYKKKFEQIIKNKKSDKKLIAIGEIGLDYHYDNLDKERQKQVFSFQLSIAHKYNLPVIIHSRDATKDTIETLKKYNLKGIIHCYSGSLQTAKEYITMGYKLGIGGLLTFKNCNLKNCIKQIGLQNIVLETDAPYMTPEPFRKNINEPKYIKIIAKHLANIFDKSINEIADITTKNAIDIFDLDINV